MEDPTQAINQIQDSLSVVLRGTMMLSGHRGGWKLYQLDADQ